MAQDIFVFTLILMGITVFSLFIIKKSKRAEVKPFVPAWNDNGSSCYEKSEEIEYSETQKALHTLLNELETIGNVYGEIYDIECREQMSEAILNVYILQKDDYIIPQSFGLYHEDGNKAVYIALDKYIKRVSDLAKGLEIIDVKERLNLFQDEAVYSNEEQMMDEFFAWIESI